MVDVANRLVKGLETLAARTAAIETALVERGIAPGSTIFPALSTPASNMQRATARALVQPNPETVIKSILNPQDQPSLADLVQKLNQAV